MRAMPPPPPAAGLTSAGMRLKRSALAEQLGGGKALREARHRDGGHVLDCRRRAWSGSRCSVWGERNRSCATRSELMRFFFTPFVEQASQRAQVQHVRWKLREHGGRLLVQLRPCSRRRRHRPDRRGHLPNVDDLPAVDLGCSAVAESTISAPLDPPRGRGSADARRLDAWLTAAPTRSAAGAPPPGDGSERARAASEIMSAPAIASPFPAVVSCCTWLEVEPRGREMCVVSVNARTTRRSSPRARPHPESLTHPHTTHTQM